MVNKDKVIIHKIFNKIDTLTGRQFEFYTALLFKLLGYQVIKITCASGDFGTDVIIKNKKNVKIGIQCKHVNSISNTHIGYHAVEETLGGKNYYKLNKALVITNGFYSQQAIDGSKSCNVQLLDRNWIIQKLLYLIHTSNRQLNISQLLNVKSHNNRNRKDLPPKTIMTSKRKEFYDSLPKLTYPTAILMDHSINTLDKNLLCLILTIVSKTGQFYQSNKTIANELNVGKKSIIRSFKDLKNNKYIAYSNFIKNGRFRRYITSINYQKLNNLDNELRNRIKNLSHLKASIMNL